MNWPKRNSYLPRLILFFHWQNGLSLPDAPAQIHVHKPRTTQNARRKDKIKEERLRRFNENPRFKDGRPCHTGTGWSSQILPWTHLEGIYMQPDVTQLVKTGSKQAQCHWTLRLSLGNPDQNMTILITPGGEGKATTRDFGGQD